jgi:outer membrane lipoprotein carrier protein
VPAASSAAPSASVAPGASSAAAASATPTSPATVDGPPNASATAATTSGPATTAAAGPKTTTTTAQAAAPSDSLPLVAPSASSGPGDPAGGTAVTLTPSLEPAAPGSADELAAQVDEIYKPLTLFRARFEQSYQAKVAGVTKKSSGLLLVERPGKLSFRYDPPNKNRVVSDGALIRIYEADNAQMYEQPVGRTEYPGALAFIMGYGLRGSFRFVFNDKAQFTGGKVLLGSPRTPNPSYEQALFYIDAALLAKRDPGTVRRVVVIDAQKNKNRFDFTETSRPASIPASEFQFTPPPGTNVVK